MAERLDSLHQTKHVGGNCLSCRFGGFSGFGARRNPGRDEGLKRVYRTDN